MTPRQIRRLRDHLGLDCAGFAALVGAPRAAARRWERVGPSGVWLLLLERISRLRRAPSEIVAALREAAPCHKLRTVMALANAPAL